MTTRRFITGWIKGEEIVVKVEFWSVGQPKQDYAKSGVQFFLRKLTPLCAVQYLPIKEGRKGTPEERREEESRRILESLNDRDCLLLFDERGKTYTSVQFAQRVSKWVDQSLGRLIFLVGGPWGVVESIRSRAQETFSLSSFVLPHELALVCGVESVYRAFSIIKNTGYHHI